MAPRLLINIIMKFVLVVLLSSVASSSAGIPADRMLSSVSSSSAGSPAARMTVDGDGNLREPSGAPFLARGVNWGKRSMSKDGRTLYNSTDPHIAKRLLPGVNFVRLVLDFYDPSGTCATDIFQADSPSTGNIRPSWLRFIDDAVRWTSDAGLWITITLRNNYGTASPHGESTNDIPCDGDYISNETARSLWFGTWQFLASRFLNASNIAWYEPASEPHLTHGTPATGYKPCHTAAEVTQLFEGVIAAIRAVDKATPIAVAPMGYAACPGLGAADRLSDRNLIYNMNWPCHLGRAEAAYGAPVSCEILGKEVTQCLPQCAGKGGTIQYDRSLVEHLMQPTLAFQRKHKVPLWIDQLMCAPRATGNASAWLNDSLTILSSVPVGFHFAVWTWKGDLMSDASSMSMLVTDSKADKLDLSSYQVDSDVVELYATAFRQHTAHAPLDGPRRATPSSPPAWDTSTWVGAEYTPWRASNELWWHDYDAYRPDLERELPQIKRVLGLSSLRVWLHSMLYFDDATRLKANMADFLGLAASHGLGVGFVLFDDCWNHAGANLSAPCVPRKGLHNGCWMASPQDVERTSVDVFEPYVSDVVGAFGSDPRVLWWEVFNEPKRSNNFSIALRAAAYGWAKAQRPTQPVAACWDDSDATDLVDHHQYDLPWGANNAVFSDPKKGGFVTEAGARWYQKTRSDAGSPLTVLNWLHALRNLRGTPAASPFVPGVMLAWEVMVGHSQTRWHWGDPEGIAEPPIPWCGLLYPDGSPVSYTEAAAIRNYTSGGAEDAFLALETFLNATDTAAAETFLTLQPGDAPHVTGADVQSATGALYELTFWPQTPDASLVEESAGGSLRLSAGPPDQRLSVLVNVSAATFSLLQGGTTLATHDVAATGKPEGGIVADSWNLVRLLLEPHRARAWLNPQFSDATGASVPPADEAAPPVAMPPRLDVALQPGTAHAGSAAVSAVGGTFRVDYVAVLPPLLYSM